jgi:hypothetical protein
MLSFFFKPFHIRFFCIEVSEIHCTIFSGAVQYQGRAVPSISTTIPKHVKFIILVDHSAT